MKIYIVGSVASGKTTLAKRLSNKLGITCTHLDGIIHIKDESDKVWGNVRGSDDEVARLFEDTIKELNWIVEDAGRKCFTTALEKADYIIYLKPSVVVRKIRIIKRYIRQKVGIEECLYTPNVKMLRFLFKALKNYELGQDDLDERMQLYSDKLIEVKTNNEIKQICTLNNKCFH